MSQNTLLPEAARCRLLNVQLSMKTIPLTHGQYAIVDDDDYEWLSQWKWGCDFQRTKMYVVKNAYLGGGRKNPRRKKIRMHRLILGLQEGEICDHKNGNGLDNRKSNLRKCTILQNNQNRKPMVTKNGKRTLSSFKGVSFNKLESKWIAYIRNNGQLVFLGYFTDEREAARAYNEAAKKYFGEFAFLNTLPT